MSEPSSEAPGRTGRARIIGLLPWLLSASLLTFILSTADLPAVVQAFRHAQLLPFLATSFSFVVFTLFWHSLFIYLALIWFSQQHIGDGGEPPPGEARRFGYRDVVHANAAAYLPRMLNGALGFAGMIAYMHRQYGIPLGRSVAVIIFGLLTAVASMGLLAFTSLSIVQVEQISPDAREMVRMAGIAGLAGIGLYALVFVISRVTRILGWKPKGKAALFLPDVHGRGGRWWLLLVVMIVKMSSYSLFAIVTMPFFGISPPFLVTFGLMQLSTIARLLPLSAQGIGVDQVTLLVLFAAFGDREAILAYSIAYSFTKIGFRFMIGLPFFNRAISHLFTARPAEQQSSAVDAPE